jgi:hypothetical protein
MFQRRRFKQSQSLEERWPSTPNACANAPNCFHRVSYASGFFMR